MYSIVVFLSYFKFRFIRCCHPADSVFEKSVSLRSALATTLLLHRWRRLRYGGRAHRKRIETRDLFRRIVRIPFFIGANLSGNLMLAWHHRIQE
ncbi:hypothetical protein KsCSTR_04210 [Candidatus Kuenenia stuttgartiensis]|uniref:Uncharacterized protein n=1 Tax=Kuenenia stuttgartiensis TaxID=174633 RepID=Q1PXQ5_KUEST|nr:hypothetical protein KsCSTR_04210 [Candidatus Kuenenia stuttgartiensis]CAJ72818.1 unknown protein [Candidatus Kuenenia stuttgartiensis]